MGKMEALCKLRDIYRAIASFEVMFEEKYHLSLNEGMLLCSLSKRGSLQAGESSDLLGVTHSNASKLIRSVEDKELIERVLGKVDKRQMHFSLSEKGKRVLADIKCGEMELPAILQEAVKCDAAK